MAENCETKARQEYASNAQKQLKLCAAGGAIAGAMAGASGGPLVAPIVSLFGAGTAFMGCGLVKIAVSPYAHDRLVSQCLREELGNLPAPATAVPPSDPAKAR